VLVFAASPAPGYRLLKAEAGLLHTPLMSGMPILDAAKAKHLIFCNFDDMPGYAGVPNPLYNPSPDVLLLFDDAKYSIDT
jgi:NAD/NADP transhydrogenase beta subunit